MARSVTSTQSAALNALHRSTHTYVLMEDPDGLMVDVTDLEGYNWLVSVDIDASMDQPVGGARITLWRNRGSLSLAPLIEGSAINRDSGDAYAPFVNPSRKVEVWVAPMIAGSEPGSGDRLLLWEGYVDDPDWGGSRSRLTFHARDPVGRLNDTFIEESRTYGGGSPPTPIEDVMQQILNDNFGSGAFPLTVVGDPDFGITGEDGNGYELANVTVLEALTELRDQIGWNLHWKWDESAGEFRLTLYQPARDVFQTSPFTPDWTFGERDYYDVTEIGVSQAGIRNAGKLLYTDADGVEQEVTDERSSSIAIYGRRFILLDERGSQVQTLDQAAAMLGAVLDDLESPPALQTIDGVFHWPVELGDVHTYEANTRWYDTDQDWAVFGYRHRLTPKERRTHITAGGKPSGGFARWHRRVPPVRAELDLAVRSSGFKLVPFGGSIYYLEYFYNDIGDDVEEIRVDVEAELSNDGVNYEPYSATETLGPGVSTSGPFDSEGGRRRYQTSGSDFQWSLHDRAVKLTFRGRRVVSGSFVYSAPYVLDIGALREAGSGITADDGSGGLIASDRFVPGTNITIDADGSGRPRINAAGGGGASALDDLSDVTIATPADGEALFYDAVAAAWQNRDIAAGDVRSGIFGLARGGTGRSSVTSGNLIVGAGASAMTLLAPGTVGGFVRSDGSAWVRATIQASDLPSHNHAASQITSGELSVARGGTGRPEVTGGRLLTGAGTGIMQELDFGAAGGFVRSNGSTWYRDTIQDSDIGQSAVTQHQAALAIAGTQLTGTVPSARLSGAYTGVTGLGTLTSLVVSGPVRFSHGEGLRFLSAGSLAGVPGNDTRVMRIEDSNTPTAPDGALVVTSGSNDLPRQYWGHSSIGFLNVPINFPGGGQVTTGSVITGMTWQGATVGAPYGGTGFGGGYLDGAILYGSGGGLARTSGGSTADYLRGGATPSWQDLNGQIDARFNANRTITATWGWRDTGDLRAFDIALDNTASAASHPGVAGHGTLFVDAGTPYFRDGGGAVSAFSLAGHTHAASQITPDTFGAGNYTIPGNLTLSAAGSIFNFSAIATGTDFLRWSGTGTKGLRKITDQGGVLFHTDSSILMHAGDSGVALVTDLGIVASTAVETLYLTADGAVRVITNRQTDFASVHEWEFRTNGVTLFPTGQVSASGVITGMSWQGAVVSAVYGGTGFGGSYVDGSLLYGSGGGLARTLGGSTSDYLRGGATPSWQNLNTAIDGRITGSNFNITAIWSWTTGQLRVDSGGDFLLEEFAGTKTGVAGYVSLYPNASNSGRMSYKLGTGGTLYWLPRANAAETIPSKWTFGAGLDITGDLSVTGEVTGGTSDERLKTPIRFHGSVRDQARAVRVGYYRHTEEAAQLCPSCIDPDEERFGLIAQDLGRITDYATKLAPLDNVDGRSKTGKNYLTYRDRVANAILWAYVQELDDEVRALRYELEVRHAA